MRPTTPVSAAGGLSPNRLRVVMELIERNLDATPSLGELAAAARLNVFQFSRCFRDSVGQTPFSYLQQRRVERAREYLRAARLTIREVARACGFSDPLHFTRTFRRWTGMTPAAYRQLDGFALTSARRN